MVFPFIEFSFQFWRFEFFMKMNFPTFNRKWRHLLFGFFPFNSVNESKSIIIKASTHIKIHSIYDIHLNFIFFIFVVLFFLIPKATFKFPHFLISHRNSNIWIVEKVFTFFLVYSSLSNITRGVKDDDCGWNFFSIIPSLLYKRFATLQ